MRHGRSIAARSAANSLPAKPIKIAPTSRNSRLTSQSKDNEDKAAADGFSTERGSKAGMGKLRPVERLNAARGRSRKC
jgi:hypothetical protein